MRKDPADMDFSERLKRATQRGVSARAEKAFADAADALSEEEQRRRHSQHRLALVDHVESRLRDLAESLPGFRFETVVDDSGWGAAISRDDLVAARGRRDSHFSRLRMVVSKFNEFHVVDVAAKGTVRNKDSFVRNHYRPVAEADLDEFRRIVDGWVLDYAEMYAGS